MRIPRIYHPNPLTKVQYVSLCDDAVNHVARVLRMKCGDKITLFDGSNYNYCAELVETTKKQVKVKILTCNENNKESPLHVHLGQVVSRGDKMDFTIQKSVELGVNIITPLLSTYCGVKLDTERWQKKMSQWEKTIISSCEQCGRNSLPELRPMMSLTDWCIEADNAIKITLNPKAKMGINSLPAMTKVRLLIGPEGGLSTDEIMLTQQYGFTNVLLGPRILRTETAALTAITALQVRFGDLG